MLMVQLVSLNWLGLHMLLDYNVEKPLSKADTAGSNLKK